MFNDSVTKNIAKDIRSLLDDAGKRDNVNDAALFVGEGMLKREGHAGKCLAAAGRHGECEYPWRLLACDAALRQYICAHNIDWTLRCHLLGRHEGVKQRLEFFQICKCSAQALTGFI